MKMWEFLRTSSAADNWESCNLSLHNTKKILQQPSDHHIRNSHMISNNKYYYFEDFSRQQSSKHAYHVIYPVFQTSQMYEDHTNVALGLAQIADISRLNIGTWMAEFCHVL